jgi:surface polysaccharide O-acyltransferase-like enzyme
MGQWAVPFFFVAAGYFQGSRLAGGSPNARAIWSKARIARLLPPYAFWTVVYVGVGVVRALCMGGQIPRWNALSVIFLGGADPVLWFLPALLYSGLIASAWHSRAIIPLALIADAVFLLADHPVTNNIFISRFPLAVALTVYGYRLRPTEKRSIGVSRGLAIALLVSAGCAGALLFSVHDLTDVSVGLLNYLRLRLPWLAGAVFFRAALDSPLDAGPAALARLAPATLGAYLIHQLVLYGFEAMLDPLTLPGFVWVSAAFMTAAVVSFAAAQHLTRLNAARRLVS